jgi:hypothetical protein
VRIWLLALALLSAAIAGADQAVYMVRGDVLPSAHAVNGYVLDVRERSDGAATVHVETSMTPIGARGSYGDVLGAGAPAVPPGFELPADLRTGLRPEMSAWQAATEVLAWVWDNLALLADDRRPQDAASVIAARGGRCSGLANATAALLLAAGFEARTVSGLLIDGRRAIPHRWVECRLPGAGWVPTDPTLGWWTITPRHLVFADAVERAPEVSTVRSKGGELRDLPRERTVLVRPDLGAELVCRLDRVAGGPKVVARLERGGDRRHAVLAPEATFGSLLPGRWLLEVELEGRVVERRQLDLRAGALHSYVVRLPAAASGEEVGS